MSVADGLGDGGSDGEMAPRVSDVADGSKSRALSAAEQRVARLRSAVEAKGQRQVQHCTICHAKKAGGQHGKGKCKKCKKTLAECGYTRGMCSAL